MVGGRETNPGFASALDDGIPRPTLAIFRLVPQRLYVYFDRQLQPRELNAGSWSCKTAEGNWSPTFAEADGTLVVVDFDYLGGAPQTPTCSYSDALQDVRALVGGLPSPEWEDYPLTPE
jgi:hypothetical protein